MTKTKISLQGKHIGGRSKHPTWEVFDEGLEIVKKLEVQYKKHSKEKY